MFLISDTYLTFKNCLTFQNVLYTKYSKALVMYNKSIDWAIMIILKYFYKT